MNCLIIFAKDPIIEPVKTRLAALTGETRARELYKKFLDMLIKNHKAKDYDVFYFVLGDIAYFEERGCQIHKQSNGELGEKIGAAFGQMLKDYKKVILIGSDLPTISEEDVQAALKVLDEKEIVIGPAADGGYYLIGLKRMLDVFGLEKWSHAKVLEDTLKIINQKGYSYGLLEEKRDIDTLDDYAYYREKAVF
jgi:uncharacterized protein